MAIRKRRQGWYIDIYVDGRRVRKSAGTRDEHAARILEQTMLGLHKGTTPRQKALEIVNLIVPEERKGVLLSDLVAWYGQCLVDEKADTAKRTIRQRLNNVRGFVAWCAENTSAKWCEEIETEQAFAYTKHLGERGILGKTLNSYCGDVSTVWKMLIKRGKAKANPWQFVRVRRDRENEHTGRAFTREEFDSLLTVARAVGFDWDGMVLVGLYTGLRMPDVGSLKWSEVNLETNRIDLEPTKTRHYGIEVHIPIHPRLREYLESVPRTGEHVMPFRASHPAGYKARGGDVKFAEILRRAGIGKASERDKLSFHCLRHTFVSWLAEAGVARDIRMKLVGHTNADTHAIYDHDLSEAIKAIAKLD